MPNATVRANDIALPKSRRAALALLAGLPASAVVGAMAAATSLDPDPIFGAITRHKMAEHLYVQASDRTDTVRARKEGREVTDDDQVAHDVATKGEQATRAALLDTVPQTLAGARLGLEYVASIDWGGEELTAFA
jgi:hypothetical protein